MKSMRDQPTLVPGIAEAIRRQILEGKLKEGEVIHQTELAKELGVSPVPLREALRRLETEGLVQFLPYRGTIVAPVTAPEIFEIFSVGVALGSIMLPQALPRLRDEDFLVLRELAHVLDHTDARMEEVTRFYMTLLQPSGMTFILEMLRNLFHRSVRIYALTQENRIQLREMEPTRAQFVAALETRDLQVAQKAYLDYHAVRKEGLLKAFAERE
jgi:DNA-binding GntR family transcriptional regulator